MITSNKLLLKKFGQLAVLVMLSTSIVTLTQKETLAVPLEPVLDQVGRRMVERSLGIDSTQAASSEDKADEDVEQSSPTLDPTEETAPTPVNSAEEQPTDQQAAPQPIYPPAYPQPSIPAYPQPTYPQPTFPPAYPQQSIPAYPQPTIPPDPQLPMNVTPVYLLPQAYPLPNYSPTPINRTPVIINNF